MDFENKRQRSQYFRAVNAVLVEEPIRKSKWSHVPITFSEQDLDLRDYPHTDAFVMQAHIDTVIVDKVLVDNGSQADIIFYNTFLKMGYSDTDLEPSYTLLYGFGGKRVEPAGKIKFTVSFGDTSNARTEFITFDIVKI